MLLDKKDYRDHPGISNSKMSWILPENGGSKEKFEYMVDNPQVQEESEEMSLGTAVHAYIELRGKVKPVYLEYPGPLLKATMDLIRTEMKVTDITMIPSAKFQKMAVDCANACEYGKAWKEETILKKIKEDGAPYLGTLLAAAEDPSMVLINSTVQKKFDEVCTRLNKSALIMNPEELYPDCKIFDELPIVWEEKGVSCKALLDRVILNELTGKVTIFDWKTTSLSIPSFIGYETMEFNPVTGKTEKKWITGEMYKRSVHRQLAFYKRAAHNQFGVPMENIDPCIIAINTMAPYSIQGVKMLDTWIDIGKMSADRAISLISDTYST